MLANDLGTLFANNEPNKDPSVHIHQPVYVHRNKVRISEILIGLIYIRRVQERGTVEMERSAGRRAP